MTTRLQDSSAYHSEQVPAVGVTAADFPVQCNASATSRGVKTECREGTGTPGLWQFTGRNTNLRHFSWGQLPAASTYAVAAGPASEIVTEYVCGLLMRGLPPLRLDGLDADWMPTVADWGPAQAQPLPEPKELPEQAMMRLPAPSRRRERASRGRLPARCVDGPVRAELLWLARSRGKPPAHDLLLVCGCLSGRLPVFTFS
ncbi:hypothetical protein GGR56DRAFT_266677 [Xylariaceae sp. FL0804]|nr:hypothetical protein GGR56DRAFT_266677 [Xylariaceae sp. FL0804]